MQHCIRRIWLSKTALLGQLHQGVVWDLYGTPCVKAAEAEAAPVTLSHSHRSNCVSLPSGNQDGNFLEQVHTLKYETAYLLSFMATPPPPQCMPQNDAHVVGI